MKGSVYYSSETTAVDALKAKVMSLIKAATVEVLERSKCRIASDEELFGHIMWVAAGKELFKTGIRRD